jgi:hypothetical protein
MDAKNFGDYERVDTLQYEPIIGSYYYVPCVMGENEDFMVTPVLLPSHEDGKYFRYYDDKLKYRHHFHIDIRFSISLYARQANIISPLNMTISYRLMLCRRKMPLWGFVDLRSKKFINDHIGKSTKCMRCPHKGVDLTTIPSLENGDKVCPSHGLMFKKHGKEMICYKQVSIEEKEAWLEAEFEF